jgi:uncharacterized membrane-anchored protein YjiN (DUF445 family)
MDKATELRRSKRLALAFLLAASALFVVTAFLPRSLWVDALKAVSEAAMVGALADWFAVTALFRKIPIPFISRHTNIIPRKRTGSPSTWPPSSRISSSTRHRCWP